MLSTIYDTKHVSSDKKITIEFNDARRHSFLPAQWRKETRADTINRSIKVDQDEDDFYLYMQSDRFEKKPIETFRTGSKYLGQWNKIGFVGKGIYRYPHGVIYDGHFNKNGEFHGSGIMVYPNGQRIEGMWKNGKLQPGCHLVAKGGVAMSKEYCTMPDRRFQIEVENDFNPVGQEYLTNAASLRRIPPDCYDLGDEYYDIKSKCVFTYGPPTAKDITVSAEEYGDDDDFKEINKDDIEKTQSEISMESGKNEYLLPTLKSTESRKTESISWIPNPIEEEWIMENCRKGWDEPTKFRPDLYEIWTKGVGDDVAIKSKRFKKQSMLNVQSRLNQYRDQGNSLKLFIQNSKLKEDEINGKILNKMIQIKTSREDFVRSFVSPREELKDTSIEIVPEMSENSTLRLLQEEKISEG